MSTQIILKVLALRRRLRQRDRWTRLQLEEHQDRALRRLREHAYVRSLFYRRFHKGFTDRPLGDLPILTKEMVMEHFDELVTDPTVRLTDVEAHLATLSGGDELFGGRYRVDSTSGSAGRRGLFLWDPGEWASVLTSYNRSFDWAGVRAGLTHRTRMAVVSSITPGTSQRGSVPRLVVSGCLRRLGWEIRLVRAKYNDAPFNRRWLTRLGNEGRQRWLMLLWCLSMMAAVAWIVLDVWGT